MLDVQLVYPYNILAMTEAAKKHDAAYSDFVVRMFAVSASEEASMARFNASVTRYIGAADTSAQTVRPSKKG